MYLNEVTIRPRLETDSASNERMSQSGNPTTINIENVINISHEGPCKAETAKSVNLTLPPASPSPSARSSSISIASIESDAASSVIESDVDEYEDTKTGCVVKKLGQQTANTDENNPIANLSPEIAVLLGQKIEKDVAGSNGPQIASLSLTNSTDVTFGHKKYHKGPVTIQQILIEKPTHRGNNNPAFEGSTSVDRMKHAEPGPQNNERPLPQDYKNILNHRIAVITAVIVLITLLLGIVVITVTNFIRDGTLLNVDSTNEEKSLLMISRDEWVAQPPNVPLDDLEAPIPLVIITHTATQNCTTKPMCIFRTRFIQTFDVESKSYDDIRYNFLVGGDGNVYVGRGWSKVGAHTNSYNEDSVGIAFIGTFNRWAPPEAQINATQWLLSEGIRLKKLDPNYKLYGSRQLDPLSDGPGDVLHDIITKWPHWSNITVD